MHDPLQQFTRAVVIGVSAGGVAALKHLLGSLSSEFPAPILIVQHIAADSVESVAYLLNAYCKIRVKEAEECEIVQPGTAYVAPANYHLMVESDYSVSLSTDPPICYARPSIDVLFESAADAYGSRLIGVILTGANFDGSFGLKKIKENGGIAVIQDPADAEVDGMPRAALEAVVADYVLPLNQIGELLSTLARASVVCHQSELC